MPSLRFQALGVAVVLSAGIWAVVIRFLAG